MSKEYGWMRTTFRAPCDLSEVTPSKEWIATLLRQNPDLTGWPFFVDLWTPRKPEFKPKLVNDIWEAELISYDDDFRTVDHWRIDAKRGLFYAARALEDDTSPRSRNLGETLDFGLAIIRIAEILAIASSFSNFLCGEKCDSSAKISLTFKWTGLQNRSLSSWADPGRHLSEDYRCNTDMVSKNVEIPLASSPDQIALFTQKIVDELFLHFDGWKCPRVVIEDLVGKLLNRNI